MEPLFFVKKQYVMMKPLIGNDRIFSRGIYQVGNPVMPQFNLDAPYRDIIQPKIEIEK
jgi:hypothetical protein